jgi:hypothetical protein
MALVEQLDTFLRRAGDLSRGMKLLRDDNAFTQSAALLAIHAAIAYADALRVGYGDDRLSSDDHSTALAALRRCVNQHEDLTGVVRLQKLLSEKTAVAYGPKRLDVQKLRQLCLESERFALWANKIGQAGIAHWRSE